MFSLEYSPELQTFEIETVHGHRFHINVVETQNEGREGQKERLARDGFRSLIDIEDKKEEDFLFDEWRSLHGNNAEE